MSNVKILSQYIKDLSFNIENTPAIFLTPKDKPNIALSIDIDAKKIGEDTFEISLKIVADAQNNDEQFFKCDITYAGIFQIGQIDNDMIEQILLIYCPNLLFPYLRRIISNLTTDAGLAPLMIDPIDFATLYTKRKQAENSTPVNDTKN